MQAKAMMSVAAVLAAIAISGVASAATRASATADLNIRTGPGPEYNSVGVIPGNHQAMILGCIQGSLWCKVSYNGTEGWAYSKYLMGTAGGRTVVVAEQPAQFDVPAVTYEQRPANAVVAYEQREVNPVSEGAAKGAATGAAIAGPVGAVVGGTVGAIGGAIAPPPPEVHTYVTSHRVAPVSMGGDVVVGSNVPEAVELYPVPNYDYEYTYVNDVPVLVAPGSRRIIYVYR